MHAEVVEEFLCPNLGCKKAEKGHGFKRRDKLEKHENNSCKGRLPSTSSNQSTASTPPIAVSTPDDTTSTPLIHQESIPAARIDNGSWTNGGTSENQDVMLKLQRLCRTKQEALLRKEKDCEVERKDIAHLCAVIELLKGSIATTDL